MKINFLFTHVKNAGGVRIVLKYAELLSERGHDVKIIVPAFSVVRRRIYNLFNFSPRSFNNFNSNIIWADSLDEKNIPDADIVVASTWSTANVIAEYGDKKGKKFYLIQHYEGLYHGEKQKVDQTYELPLHKIVVSNWLHDILKDRFGQESEVILNSVDTEQFKFLKQRRGGKSIKILALHHNKEQKGTRRAVEIFEKLKKEYTDIELVMFGVEPKNKIIKCDKYYRNPKQEDLAKIYSSCDIFLCPSDWEGFGLPGLEAMACKCALVTFDTGGSDDYAFHGETAMVAEHGDMDDLYDQLEMVVRDEELRERIAGNGYQYARENFRWERAVEKIEKIFKDTNVIS